MLAHRRYSLSVPPERQSFAKIGQEASQGTGIMCSQLLTSEDIPILLKSHIATACPFGSEYFRFNSNAASVWKQDNSGVLIGLS